MKHVRRISNYPGPAQSNGLSLGDILGVIAQIANTIAGTLHTKETAAEEDEKIVPTTPAPPTSDGGTT